MEQKLYSVLEIVCRHVDDHQLFLLICRISKTAKRIAKANFIALTFNHTKVNEEFLARFGRRWENLQRLNLSYTQVSNNVISILQSSIPTLTHVNFTGCKLNDEFSMSFRTLLASQTKLTSFDFSETTLTEMFYTTIAATPVSTSRSVPLICSIIAQNCPNLKHPKKSAPFARDTKRPSVFLTRDLSFANCLDFSDDMTNYLLRLLTPTFSAILTKLDLTNCVSITDLSLAIISMSCPQIEELRVWGCREISNSGVSCIAHYSRRLKILDLTGCLKLNDVACQFISGVQVSDELVRLQYRQLINRIEEGPNAAVSEAAQRAKNFKSGINEKGIKIISGVKSATKTSSKANISSAARGAPKILPPTQASPKVTLSPKQQQRIYDIQDENQEQNDNRSAKVDERKQENISPNGFSMTKEYGCHDLQTLLIGKIQLTNKALACLVDGCPLISHLDIHSTMSDIDANGIVQYIPMFSVLRPKLVKRIVEQQKVEEDNQIKEEKEQKEKEQKEDEKKEEEQKISKEEEALEYPDGSQFLLELGGMPKVNGCSRRLKKVYPNIGLSFIQL
ncbi:MAG: hypothetical protein EZS28_025123 [Streblomastix strix]|uniref:RNI-like protein n=1 Tax=Streblomastix strix TaxID=222440 RepID=A0A5J4VA89_9EUKA|nr:MAG: hypothetical protein EZS28_025123 [Streblomastix strix]